MQHQMLLLSRNYLRDVTYSYLTRDGYRCHSAVATNFQSYSEAREQAIAILEYAIGEDGRAFQAINVLSIDAWRDGDSWIWNNWHKCGTLTLREFSKLGNTTRQQTRATLAWFREHGYLSDASKGAVTLEDDGYNLVVCDRRTREPLFAIEYGTAYL